MSHVTSRQLVEQRASRVSDWKRPDLQQFFAVKLHRSETEGFRKVMIICVKYIPCSALVRRPDGKFLSRQVFVVEYKDYVNVQAVTVVSWWESRNIPVLKLHSLMRAELVALSGSALVILNQCALLRSIPLAQPRISVFSLKMLWFRGQIFIGCIHVQPPHSQPPIQPKELGL